MQLIRGAYNLTSAHHGCVATIGNFDGLHRGHQQVLSGLKQQSQKLGLPSCLISFEPLPREYFAPDNAPARLLTLAEKIERLQQLSLDRLLLLPFNQSLCQQSAEAFIQQTLVTGLGVRYLVVGDDFQFGCDRKGNFELLQNAGRQFDFEVQATETFQLHGQRVSSTQIRQQLAAGKLEQAAQQLGHPFQISGRVAHGFARGRTIGFPTANISLKRQQPPLKGVFVVSATLPDGQVQPAIANIGNRPTVGGTKPLLEVHLFDFGADLYGQRLTIRFLHKLRDEQKFDSFDLLKKQIEHDANDARAFFQQSAAIQL
ncbi:MAG: bifunctional riboflavin kinase/FAD synthetase [Gammaproteobacteria bacterium]|nr:bifunctional riboflavin kinase/FAD synthetase [Gammaproteobacteria bacterium]